MFNYEHACTDCGKSNDDCWCEKCIDDKKEDAQNETKEKLFEEHYKKVVELEKVIEDLNYEIGILRAYKEKHG